jgi:hypothetical protein
MKLSSLAKVTCKICGKTGAYVEYKKPDETTSESAGIEETMGRSYYRCKFCGFEDIKTVEFRDYIYDDTPGPSIFIYNIDYEDFSD